MKTRKAKLGRVIVGTITLNEKVVVDYKKGLVKFVPLKKPIKQRLTVGPPGSVMPTKRTLVH